MSRHEHHQLGAADLPLLLLRITNRAAQVLVASDSTRSHWACNIERILILQLGNTSVTQEQYLPQLLSPSPSSTYRSY